MSNSEQYEFLERCIAKQRRCNQPDLLRLWQAQQEQSHLNEMRSFYRSINWGI